jgi:hypothetical protein
MYCIILLIYSETEWFIERWVSIQQACILQSQIDNLERENKINERNANSICNAGGNCPSDSEMDVSF